MDSVRSYGQQAWNKSLAFMGSTGLIPQLVLTVIIVLVIHLIILTVESLLQGIKRYNRLSATLLPYTYVSKGDGSGTQNVTQKFGPDAKNDYPLMYPSENEVNGLEFSYSFHLYIDPSNTNFPSTAEVSDFRTVFYKGSANGPWPVMGPGVFVNQKDNTLRIYMNSISDVMGNFVEIPNVPVGKWFHMVLVQRGQNMDVFLNGNIAVRKTFKEVPMINFGGMYVFPNGTVNKTITGDTERSISIKGAMEGMISRVKYYSYAISFNQIDALLTEGASSKIVSSSFEHTPPYLHDSWWVTRYKPSSQYYGL